MQGVFRHLPRRPQHEVDADGTREEGCRLRLRRTRQPSGIRQPEIRDNHRPHREVLSIQSALQRLRLPEQGNQGRAYPCMGLPEMRGASRSRPQRGKEHPRRRAAHPFQRKGNGLKYKLGGASSNNRSFRKSLARGQETLVTLESHGFSRGSMSSLL